MSTKSRARALRRHPQPELENERAREAIGASILSVVTLGLLEPDTEIATSNSAPPHTEEPARDLYRRSA